MKKTNRLFCHLALAALALAPFSIHVASACPCADKGKDAKMEATSCSGKEGEACSADGKTCDCSEEACKGGECKHHGKKGDNHHAPKAKAETPVTAPATH